MTKLEICAIEDANQGQVNLYPEGSFYKAYQKNAWLLCTRVHPFKVSARPLKGLDGPLLSVGFPLSSLDKFSAGLIPEALRVQVFEGRHYGIRNILYICRLINSLGYDFKRH